MSSIILNHLKDIGFTCLRLPVFAANAYVIQFLAEPIFRLLGACARGLGIKEETGWKENNGVSIRVPKNWAASVSMFSKNFRPLKDKKLEKLKDFNMENPLFDFGLVLAISFVGHQLINRPLPPPVLLNHVLSYMGSIRIGHS